MKKTTVSIKPNGAFVVETRNRHEMALRWLNVIKGKKHIRLLERPEASSKPNKSRSE